MACESCLRTHHIGLMMVVNWRKPLVFVMAVAVMNGAVAGGGVAFSTPVKDSVLDRIGLIDARHPDGAASLVTPAQAPSGTWRFLRLQTSLPTPIECCMQAGDEAESSVLQLSGEEIVETVAHAATFHPALKQGFIGLAVRGDARVRVVSANRVMLSWPNQARRMQVDHCLSEEGLHVLLRSGRGGKLTEPPLHFYVPLEAAVTPNCTPALLNEKVVGSRH